MKREQGDTKGVYCQMYSLLWGRSSTPSEVMVKLILECRTPEVRAPGEGRQEYACWKEETAEGSWCKWLELGILVNVCDVCQRDGNEPKGPGLW